MAAIIEKITGTRFETYIEETFLKPIGLPTADYFLTPRSARLLSKNYRQDGSTPFPYWHIVMRPSGALNASAREMGANELLGVALCVTNHMDFIVKRAVY